MKKIFFSIFFVFMLIVSAAFAADTIVVKGIGYPPIKSESKAQAHLMAKRAAIIDAYRNALSRKIPQSREDAFYSSISGYVKNARMVNIEYLEDGGVLVEMEVPARDVSVIKRQFNAKTRDNRQELTNDNLPRRVTIDEWYNIINRFTEYPKN